MSEKVSIEAKVTKSKSGRNGTEISFKNLSNKVFGFISNKFNILFSGNPGWEKGDKIRLTAELIEGGSE